MTAGMVEGQQKARAKSRELTLYAGSLLLVSMVAISVTRSVNVLFLAIVLSAIAATGFLRWLFPGRAFFSLTFANLIAVYAAIFEFFVEDLFGHVTTGIEGIGFSLPVMFFIAGCWFRREDLRAVVENPHIRVDDPLHGALAWLIMVFLVGVAGHVLSLLDHTVIDTAITFLAMMAAIGLVVFFVSRSVVVFLVDVGLLFEEFSERMTRLAVPAFAFLTFYSLLVIFFAAAFSILSQFSTGDHFRVGQQLRVISFSEAIHFSIVTISTVGYGDIVPASNLSRILASFEVICGVMLLLFGVSELLEYTREHRRSRKD